MAQSKAASESLSGAVVADCTERSIHEASSNIAVYLTTGNHQMKKVSLLLSLVVTALLTVSTSANAAEWGLKEGTPELKSAGALAFGPDGILFVGDTKAATVYAIATGDNKGKAKGVKHDVSGLSKLVADELHATGDVKINDLAVNASSGSVYLSVTEGGNPAVVRVDAAGKVSAVSLKNVAFSKVALPNPPEDKVVRRGRRERNARDDSITDIAYVDGRLIVSGLSSTSAPSTVHEIAFPFVETDSGSSVEIYHGAHGKREDYSAIRTFVPFNINGKPNLLAAYVCTPLVRFPLDSLKPGKKAQGTTVAELGNRNRPLDMIVYEKDGADYILLTNSARGVMKIGTEEVATADINERISGTAGQSYETIAELQNVEQLDRLDEGHAVILVASDAGSSLKTIALP